MENETSADVVGEPSAKLQFGKGPSYRGQKSVSPKMAMICAAVGVLALVPILQISAPEKPVEREGVALPQAADLSVGPSVQLESYSRIHDEAMSQGKPTAKRPLVVRYAGVQSISRPKAARIPPGSLVRAVLTTGASNGPVRAELKESLRIQGETLVPEGSALIGSGQSTEDRLYIRFGQVVYRDGSFEPIQAQAADSKDQTVGLIGSKVGRYAMKLGAAVGLNFASGMAEGLQQKEAVGQQTVNKADARNALLNGASRASLELANEIMSDLKNQTPVIEVPAGTEILILFGSE